MDTTWQIITATFIFFTHFFLFIYCYFRVPKVLSAISLYAIFQATILLAHAALISSFYSANQTLPWLRASVFLHIAATHLFTYIYYKEHVATTNNPEPEPQASSLNLP